jgi:hypothetical protein
MKDILLDVLFLDRCFDLLQRISGSDDFPADERDPSPLMLAYFFCVYFFFIHMSTLSKTVSLGNPAIA